MAEEKAQRKTIALVDVKRIGDALILPATMTYDEGIETLQRLKKQDDEVVQKKYTFHTSPPEGAIALQLAIETVFGFSTLAGSPGWFGEPNPPQYIVVDTGVDQRREVPWGKFSLPGTRGEVVLETYAPRNEQGQYEFGFQSTMKRKWQDQLNKVVAKLEEILRDQPLYRGQAFRIKFRDGDGDLISFVQPKFMNLDKIAVNQIVYTRELERSIEINLLTPIRHREAVKKAGVPSKRGLLFAGPYGTGKTLLALKTAITATQCGYTFIYVQDAYELADAVAFAQRYAPAVIFVEDIDRVLSGPRSTDMDEILNVVDGIESKNKEIMLIATSNNVDSIHPAMKRAGRFDVILEVLPPDAEAVQRLVRVYADNLLPEDENLESVGVALAGQIPAVIREVVERAKLACISRTAAPIKKGALTSQDVADAADSMLNQLRISAGKPEVRRIDPETVRMFGYALAAGAEETVQVAEDDD